jgi:hypothetical protein
MAPNDILALLRARPFRAFRIVTSDGTVYDVNHPEPYERYDIVSMRHIVRLEPAGQEIEQA